MGFLLSLITSDLTATTDPKWVREEEIMGVERRSLLMDPTNGDDKLLVLVLLSDLVLKRDRGWMILAEKAILLISPWVLSLSLSFFSTRIDKQWQ